MKTLVLYRNQRGLLSLTRSSVSDEEVRFEYDENAPCMLCGLSVVEASMSGVAVCPWCDLGICRFDYKHRVDMEGIDPDTGKMYPPRKHYERCHPEKIATHEQEGESSALG